MVLGVASPLLVERWNGIPYHRLHDRLSDVLHFVRSALDGGRVPNEFKTFTSTGFALPGAVESPMLLVAACGERALELAATEADGVVLNWITPDDLDRIAPLRWTKSSCGATAGRATSGSRRSNARPGPARS
jgi:alkanesulfonate monooxygenase SsuD/methylene tetrahydromethanopterin reductase-like flavin-dependent oxidoreductase (luciferase family)